MRFLEALPKSLGPVIGLDTRLKSQKPTYHSPAAVVLAKAGISQDLALTAPQPALPPIGAVTLALRYVRMTPCG